MLIEVVKDTKDCIDGLLHANKPLQDDYNKYANFKKWASIKDVAARDARLIETADARALYKSEHWSVE